MSNKFTQKAQQSLNSALSYASSMGHTYVGSEHLVLGLIGEYDSVASKLMVARGADLEKAKRLICDIAGEGSASDVSASDMTPRLKKIIEVSAGEANKAHQTFIGTEHLLSAMLSERDCVGCRVLEGTGVRMSELRADLSDIAEGMKSVKGSSRGYQKSEKSVGGALKSYGRDLTDLARRGLLDPVIGREDESERVIRILSRRSKNNPCLIGEPGVGKTAVVEGLAERIAERNVPEQLVGKSIIMLDIPSMIAGAKYRGEFEERMKNVMDEVSKDPDVILFVDEFHTLIGAGAAEGAVDAANIIKPALARGEMQMIGATTLDEYRRHIEKDAALERRFQPVMINEPSEESAKQILSGLLDKYEAHHRLKISDEAIDAAVTLSSRYISDRFLPDKAIDLIDEAAAGLRITLHSFPTELKEYEKRLQEISEEKSAAINSQEFETAAKLRDEEIKLTKLYTDGKAEWESRRDDKSLTLTRENIAAVVTQQTGIPVSKLVEGEEEKLSHLEDELKKRIIGQDEAISALAGAIRRGRAGLKSPTRPTGSFIFTGQTGVGKTELCRALGEILFGSRDSLITLDMSEYMEKQSVSKLIGSPPGYVGYEDGGILALKVRQRPYSVVLFDEIEKAHPDIFNILLQVLDNGILTDSQGRRVNFRNTVIIMTSNVGAGGANTGPLGFSDSVNGESEARKKRTNEALRMLFKPEFLGRVDSVIYFKPLCREDIEKICRLMLSELADRTEKLGIKLEFSDESVKHIADVGYDPSSGARNLRRKISTEIEDKLASDMISGKISSPSDILVGYREGDGIFFDMGKSACIC